MTRRGIALTATAVALGLPGVAAAGVATSDGGTARFADPTGANDDLSVTLELITSTPDVDPQGWNVLFYSLGEPVTWGAGCGEGFVGTICPYGPAPPGAIAVELAGGDDRLGLAVDPEAAAAPTSIAIAGGAGNDQIATVRARAEIDGGDGDDVIRPDEREALDFPPGPTPGGVIRGGAGTDTADYEQALDPIAVSLDGAANDGRPGEGDNVHRDVENVTGGHYGNTLTGGAAANALIGGSGQDRIAGGAGRDALDGRSGDDTLDALDAAAGDRVECGDGADVALVDAGDVVLADQAACENVTWAPRLAASKLRYRDGRIALTLSCPKAASRCRGAVLLRKAKTLARASYRIKRGKRAALRLKPTRAGRSAFKRRSVKVTAVVRPAGAATDSGRQVTVRR